MDAYQELLKLSQEMHASAVIEDWERLVELEHLRSDLVRRIEVDRPRVAPVARVALTELLKTVQQLDALTLSHIQQWQSDIEPLLKILRHSGNQTS